MILTTTPMEIPIHNDLLSSLLPIHEPLRRGKNLVALIELLEENSVGETKVADSDALQDPIALQLFKNQASHDLAAWEERRIKEARLIIQHTWLF